MAIEIESAEASIELATNEDRASVARFHTETAPHLVGVLDALRELREHAGAIDAIFAETNAAAAECRKAGLDMPDLDKMHTILPLLLELGIVPKRDGLVRARNDLAWIGLRGALLKSTDEFWKVECERPEHTEARVTELKEVFLESRTLNEAEARLVDRHTGAKVAAGGVLPPSPPTVDPNQGTPARYGSRVV